MSKSNLIIVTITTLILVCTTSLFGQTKSKRVFKQKAQTTKSAKSAKSHKTKFGQRKPLAEKLNQFEYDNGIGYTPTNQRKRSNTNRTLKNAKSAKPKNQNLLPYMEQSNLRKKGKYANQEVSYRKNKTRRKNK